MTLVLPSQRSVLLKWPRLMFVRMDWRSVFDGYFFLFRNLFLENHGHII